MTTTSAIETLTTNERDLIVLLLQKFGASIAKPTTYAPDCFTNPIMLTICNNALDQFGEAPITEADVA